MHEKTCVIPILKVKLIRISIYYFMYKHLYNMTLNLDVAFLLSVSIFMREIVIMPTCGLSPFQSMGPNSISASRDRIWDLCSNRQ